MDNSKTSPAHSGTITGRSMGSSLKTGKFSRKVSGGWKGSGNPPEYSGHEFL